MKKTIKILIVEDSKVQAKILKHLLEINNYKVQHANDGEEALNILKQEIPNIIISDIMMPKINGYELCRRIRLDEKLKKIPVILLTSLYGSQEILKSLECGADSFITKPYSDDFLISKVKNTIRSKKRRRKDQITEPDFEIIVDNQKHLIGSDRSQIVDFLLSANENAVKKNRELDQINKEFELTQGKLNKLNENLEEEVNARSQRIEHLNAVLRTISNIHQLIIKEKDRNALIQKVCENFINTRGFHSAWIALFDDKNKIIDFVAKDNNIDILKPDNRIQRNYIPICIKEALNSESIILKKNRELDCKGCPRLKLYNSNESGNMVLNLKYGKKNYGVLNISLPTHYITNKEEQSLFTEIAEDIAFGLYSIELEEKRKQVDKVLQESEEKYRNFIETSTDLVFRLTKTGYIDFVSPSVENLYGYKPDELIGKHLRTTTPVGEITKAIKALSMVFAGKPLTNFNINQKHKNGQIIPMEINAVPIYQNRKITGLQGIMRDITKRIRAEQIQKVLYNISNAVITTDSLDKLINLIQEELGAIIDTTNFYIAFYNKETDTLTSPFYVDEKDKFTSIPAGKTLTKYVVETKKPLLANIDVKKKLVEKGKLIHVGSLSKIWLGVPLKIKNKVTGVLAVQSYTNENAYTKSDMEMLEFVTDQISISIERKKAEEELKTALYKATEADRLKSAFLATMSHELRTPLNAIIGFSEIITKDLPINDIIEFTKIINSSGNQLLTIIKNIFDITLIESGQTKIGKGKENLHVILKNIHEIIKIEQHITNKNHIDLNLILQPEGAKLAISTDPSKLKQILINLLKNAFKFTNEGFINYGYEIETDKDKSMLKFFVKDTGIGIPENKRKFIFDIFRQVDESYTRRYGGTGIGLSISKKLTELLGGKMWLESSKNGGSVFYFTIPHEGLQINDKSTEKKLTQK